MINHVIIIIIIINKPEDPLVENARYETKSIHCRILLKRLYKHCMHGFLF